MQKCVVLNSECFTFFWKRTWLEVACQYSNVPPEWVAMNVFFKVDVVEVLAMHVTGVLSSFTKLYWIACLFTDKTLIIPSVQPRVTNPDAGRYYVDITGLSTVNS